MKAYSSLMVNFGLLNFEVKLYPLRDKTDKIDFKGLSDCCKKETGLKRICKNCLKELSWKTELKGYKIGKNTFVELTIDELDTIERLDNGIEILYFSDAVPISTLDKPYFLEPTDTKINKKLYSLFNNAFVENNKIAIVRAVIKGYEHFGVIRHDKKGLVLQFIERNTNISIDLEPTQFLEQEAKQLSEIVKQNSKSFSFDELKNTYVDKVRTLIEAKSQGKVIEVISKSMPALEDTKLLDTLNLMSKKTIKVKVI